MIVMEFDPRILAEIDRHPHPLLFVTISGAHLYGFPSPDSDFDLRGAHVLPLRDAISLFPGHDTVESSGVREGLEIDLVTHDVKKFFGLMLKKNGYVLEQLYSPLVVRTSREHDELKSLGAGCITRFHAFHYLGFAETQWKLFSNESPRRIKPLLYVYRVLLTGIHLMKTGKLEANLVNLSERYSLPYVPDLISRKLAGPEQGTLADGDFGFHQREYERLRGELETAQSDSTLPERPSSGAALDDLLFRIRTS